MTAARTNYVTERFRTPGNRKDRRLKWLWMFAGLVTLAAWAGISLLSRSFVFGAGHADRPIPEFLLLYAAVWLTFAAACVLAVRTRARPIAMLAGVGVLARALLLPSNLIQENDCYRYVLDGETLVHGVNPYANSPAELASEAPHRLRKSLESSDARRVLGRIGHAGVSTIYPPVAQAAFACGVLITPWDWRGQRYIFVACDLATAGVLLLILRELHRPSAWIVFYAWNPLVIKEVANSAHLDSLTALFVIVLAFVLVRWGCAKSTRGAALAGVLLAAATLTKFYPALLLPVVLACFWRWSPNMWPMIAGSITFLVVSLAAYVPFLSVGFEQLFLGLKTYAQEWRNNPGAFAVIEVLLPWPRVVAGVISASVAIGAGIWLVARLESAGSALAAKEQNTYSAVLLVRALQTTLLTWFLLLPAPYPWYAIPMLALAALSPAVWPVVLSGSLALYYLHFYVDYQGFEPAWHGWIDASAHVPIWIALLVSGVAGYRSRSERGRGDMKSAEM